MEAFLESQENENANENIDLNAMVNESVSQIILSSKLLLVVR